MNQPKRIWVSEDFAVTCDDGPLATAFRSQDTRQFFGFVSAAALREEINGVYARAEDPVKSFMSLLTGIEALLKDLEC